MIRSICSGRTLWTELRRVVLILSIASSLGGCGAAAKEKTAPCRRPANLAGYAADPRVDCGPMLLVNPDGQAALKAIGEIPDHPQ